MSSVESTDKIAAKNTAKGTAAKSPSPPSKQVELHIITGFLGSGKTNVLCHLIGAPAPEGRFGVVVGEFADEGYDGGVIEETGHVVRMVSGLRAADRGSVYVPAVRELVESGRHRRVFLETSGVTEAHKLRDALLGDEAIGNYVNFGRTTVVVDAAAFPAHMEHFGEQMRAQLALADWVVINKTDKVGPADLADARRRVREINPDAEVQFAYMGQVHRPSFWAPLADGRPSRIVSAEPARQDLDEFESIMYRTPQVAYDRVRFGHVLLNLPSRVARFKGVLRAYDRAYAVNGLPGQLDWDNRNVDGATRIGIIGVGILRDAEQITQALDDELQRQVDEMRAL